MSAHRKIFLATMVFVTVLVASYLSMDLRLIPANDMFLEDRPARLSPHLLHTVAFCLGLGVLTSIMLSGELVKSLLTIDARSEPAFEFGDADSPAGNGLVANMRHDMRKPLNSVIRLSEHIFREPSLCRETRECVEKIHNAGMTLLGVINDTVSVSGSESKKFAFTPIEYDVTSLIHDILTLNIIRFGDRPVKFNVDIDSGIPSRLFGDELRVELVCNKLLSNAFKYTKQGHVDLSFGCERKEDREWLTIRVADTGAGIRPEDMGGLFQRSRNPGKTNRANLATANTIVAAMGGAITAESEYGRGSVFTLRVPHGSVTSSTLGRDAAENLKRSHHIENKPAASAVNPAPVKLRKKSA
jgi:signal transduction histidine kinase